MTEAEARRLERIDRPSSSAAYKRKNKLKMRFKGERLTQEIASTAEKLRMLTEIACETAEKSVSSFSGS